MTFSETPDTTARVWGNDFKHRPNSKGGSGSDHFLRIEIWKSTSAHKVVRPAN